MDKDPHSSASDQLGPRARARRQEAQEFARQHPDTAAFVADGFYALGTHLIAASQRLRRGDMAAISELTDDDILTIETLMLGRAAAVVEIGAVMAADAKDN